MKYVRLLLLTVCVLIFLSNWTNDVNAQNYENRYCFTEVRLDNNGNYTNEFTHCYSGNAQCQSQRSAKEEGFQDSQFIGSCNDLGVAPTICQANDFSCFDVRLQSSGDIIGAPAEYAICAMNANSCSQAITRERDYQLARGWQGNYVGCSAPRTRNVCEVVTDNNPPVGPGITPPQNPSGRNLNQYCFTKTPQDSEGLLGSQAVTRCYGSQNNCVAAQAGLRLLNDGDVIESNCNTTSFGANLCQFDNLSCHENLVGTNNQHTVCYLARTNRCEPQRQTQSNTSNQCVLNNRSNICLARNAGNGESGQIDHWCFHATDRDNGTGLVCHQDRDNCLTSRNHCIGTARCSVDATSEISDSELRTCSRSIVATSSDQTNIQETVSSFIPTFRNFYAGQNSDFQSSLVYSSTDNILPPGNNTVGSGNQGNNDRDNDQIPNDQDNCPDFPNSNGQNDDADDDGVGAACDDDDNNAQVGDGDAVAGGGGRVTNLGSNAPRVDCAADFDPEFCLEDPLNRCYLNEANEYVCTDDVPNTILTLITKAVRGLTNVLIPLSVLAIVYGGLQFVIARGNESKITNAKKVFTNILIGVAFIVGARVLAEIVEALFTSL